MQFNQQHMNTLLIGTQSETRRKLFQYAGLDLEYTSPNIDEKKILQGKKITQSKQALFLAKAKCLHLCELHKNRKIVCFDTTVHIRDKTIFKASTKKECMNVLIKLNGKTHTLYTACIIMKNKKTIWSTAEKALITFKKNSKIELKKYIDAYFIKIVNSVGCYNIESEGKRVIEKIEGSYYSILGIPLIPLYRALKN
ncbi:MAG: Maf family protein [Proteobacteria bacterium]|nr:Maf family protein [Pseudomonadota bacterium]